MAQPKPTLSEQADALLRNYPMRIPNKDSLKLYEAKALMPDYLKDIKGLLPREYKFVAVYCSSGFDLMEAVKQAGYACRSPRQYRAVAYSLLRKEPIVLAIKAFIDATIQPYKDRLELELLEVYYKRATYKVDTFFLPNGSCRPLDQIPDEWKVCIDGVEERYNAGGQRRTVIYTLPNRDTALATLYKFVNGTDPNALQGPITDEARQQIGVLYQQYQHNMTINITQDQFQPITPVKKKDDV